MLSRKVFDALQNWKENLSDRALLVTGARQVGKTYLIDSFVGSAYAHVVKFDLVDQADVASALSGARSSQELFMAISAYAEEPLVPGETVIFIDEVQECKEVLTLVKYLVQRGDYDYVLSGSLLGVELDNLRSAPVGYLHVVDMYPLDFEEFCWACGVGREPWAEAKAALEEGREVFEPVHRRLLRLFHRYLVVGGMPRAAAEFVQTQNISAVNAIQEDILRLYRYDISKYAARDKTLAIKEVFDQMPSQLDSQSKRFNFASLAPKGTYERYESSFLWVVDAGVAIPVRNVSEPKRPLKLAENRSFFKLFMSDVGLLSAACGIRVARSLLADDVSVNYGSIYENAVAQELFAHRGEVFFFRNHKVGELDFVIERNGEVLPIEVKSGKSYKRHSALTNVLSTPNYSVPRAIVLHEGNVEVEGRVSYIPPYGIAFL